MSDGARDRRQAALREAALAVVAHLHGLRVNMLRLEAPAEGHELLDNLRYGLDLERLEERQFLPALKRAEIALAGQVAVERYLDGKPEPDDAIALAILEQLGDSARQREALAALVRARLHDLLDAPANRTMIEQLAEQLEREGELDRDAFMLVTLRQVKLPL
jgi:hypothetical protein